MKAQNGEVAVAELVEIKYLILGYTRILSIYSKRVVQV